jgi:hypothetical protein
MALKLGVGLMKTLQRQKGMTAISLVALLILFGFLALIALRLVPIYLDHFKVVSHLKALAEQEETASMADNDIIKTYFKRLDIDDVVDVKRDDFFIEKGDGGGKVLAVEYEVRRPVFGNVSVVVSFVDEFEVKG